MSGPLWMIATRGRPHAMERLIEAARATGDLPETAVMIDGDRGEYDHLAWPPHWHVHRSAERRELAASVNALVELHPGRSAYGFNCDHARPRTQLWFTTLVAWAGKWGAAYSEDNWLHGRWARGIEPKHRPNRHLTGGVVLGGDLVRAMGWFFYPGCVHLYVDNVLEDIVEDLGLWRWCPDVVVESEQHTTGHGMPDDNHRRLFRGERINARDRAAYERFAAEEKDALVARIRQEMLAHA